MNKAEVLVLHHSLSDFAGDQLYIINQYHKNQWEMKSTLGWYVGYHWLIEKSGKKVRCRNDWEEGVHAIGWNLKSIGICLAGDFTKEMPTKAQIESTRELVQLYKLPLRFHREVQDYRTCPGPINKSIFDPPPILSVIPDEEVKKAENIKKQISILSELVAKLRQLLALFLKK